MNIALSDIGLFLGKVATIFPGIPVVLYGQSLGGNLAVNYVIFNSSWSSGISEEAAPLPRAIQPFVP